MKKSLLFIFVLTIVFCCGCSKTKTNPIKLSISTTWGYGNYLFELDSNGELTFSSGDIDYFGGEDYVVNDIKSNDYFIAEKSEKVKLSKEELDVIKTLQEEALKEEKPSPNDLIPDLPTITLLINDEIYKFLVRPDHPSAIEYRNKSYYKLYEEFETIAKTEFKDMIEDLSKPNFWEDK